jgi:hypothetical protein
MKKSTYRLVGVYKIIPSEASFVNAARYHEDRLGKLSKAGPA